MKTDAAATALNLDLVLERIVPLPPQKIWAAWTDPELLKKWFAPMPWTTIDCQIDLRPGGRFRTVMRSPEGQEFPNEGCFLEVSHQQKLVWTDMLLPGYRPSEKGFLTIILTLEPQANGTKYTARALHKNKEDRDNHEKMGFYDGWGLCLDQLIALVKRS